MTISELPAPWVVVGRLGIRLSAGTTESLPFLGDMREQAILSRVLSSTERYQRLGYLATRYGIALAG